MTWGQRIAVSTLWGVLAGLVIGIIAISGLTYAIEKPITGCAFITITFACVVFGALVGASTKDIAA